MHNALPLIASFVGAAHQRGASQPRPSQQNHDRVEDEDNEANDGGRVRIIVFSKDRPVQLRWLLASMKRFVKGDYEIFVLWRSSYSYDKVRSEFPEVVFKEEGDLKELLLDSIEDVDRIAFCVDDVVFYRSVDLDAASRLPRDVLAFHFKLNPHVSWSHPADSACPPPLLSNDSSGANTSTPIELSWRRSDGDVDWDYGWDLCCSLYRAEDVRQVLADTMADQRQWHPNVVEARGQASPVLRKRPMSKCYAIPVASVITINCVQNVYKAPVYDHHALGSLQNINRRQDDLDYDFYRNHRFDSAHIGSVVFHREKSSSLPSVTVVVPARNASSTIVAALESIARQTKVRVYAVVVDDHSTDDTFEKALSFVATSKEMDKVRVVRNLRKPGVAGALNHGLGLVETPYVARLDADDECFADDRLATQVSFLEANASIGVVGGAAISFFGDERRRRYVGHPCDPFSLAWSLHFSCHVTHPSIVARTRVLRDVGGYSESDSVRHAEDLDLWLRLTERDPRAIANLAEPLVWLRKSSTSVSSKHRDKQRQASIDVATASIRRRLATRVDASVVAAMRSPSDPGSLELLEKAGELMLALETSFLSTVSSYSESENKKDDENNTSSDFPSSCSRARGLVSRDVDARLAEIAFLSAPSSSVSATTTAMWAGRSSNPLSRLLRKSTR